MVLTIILAIASLCFLASSPLINSTPISPGTTLSPQPNAPWTSPHSNFSMGFFSLQAGVYFLGIWYTRLPISQAVVWVANRDQPITDVGSVLEFTDDGNLRLTNSQSSVIWQTGRTAAVEAELLDTGNFVMRPATNGSETVWESFSFPTDTLLPGQDFNNMSKTPLVSWKTTTDPASSRYSLVFLEPPWIRLLYNNSVQYWDQKNDSYHTFRILPSGLFGAGSALYDQAGSLLWNGSDDCSASSSILKLTLNVDGNLRLLDWSETSSSWNTLWRAVFLQCKIFSTCGDNANCNLAQNQAFENGLEGATRCPVPEPPSSLICVSTVVDQNESSTSLPVFAVVLIVVFSVTTVLICLVYFARSRLRSSRGQPMPSYMDEDLVILNLREGLEVPRRLSFHDLYIATEGFSEACKLGSGGFGTVFKGTLALPRSPDTRLEVAVKSLKENESGGKEGENDFLAEVQILASIRHINVVKLLGYCAEGPKRLLVYEFIENGSLHAHLFAHARPLDWNTRFRIVVGAATGIEYLHSHCPKKIIHRDIKPANILLDEEFRAKVADFGVAQIMSPEKTRVTNAVGGGTPAYMAPECGVLGGVVTEQADGYSFGVTMLEIVSGKRVTKTAGNYKRILTFQDACQYMEGQRYGEFADERLEGEYDAEQLERLVKVAFWCLLWDPRLRPSMEEVLLMVKGHKMVTEPPVSGLPQYSTPQSGRSSSQSTRQSGSSSSHSTQQSGISSSQSGSSSVYLPEVISTWR